MTLNESFEIAIQVAIAILLLLGSFFSLVAGIGIVRFADTLTRIHAGTKPQVLGLACILTAVILSTRNWHAAVIMGVILIFQMLTSPAAAHMIGRAAYRRRKDDDAELFVDELEEAVDVAAEESSTLEATAQDQAALE